MNPPRTEIQPLLGPSVNLASPRNIILCPVFRENKRIQIVCQRLYIDFQNDKISTKYDKLSQFRFLTLYWRFYRVSFSQELWVDIRHSLFILFPLLLVDHSRQDWCFLCIYLSPTNTNTTLKTLVGTSSLPWAPGISHSFTTSLLQDYTVKSTAGLGILSHTTHLFQ